MPRGRPTEKSLKNLRHELTPEERRKGAETTNRKAQQKKDLCTAINDWLNSTVSTDKNGNKLTGTDYMVQVAIQEMVKGNPKFWELIRDTAGQKPIDKVAVAEVDQQTISDIENLLNDVK